MIPPRSPLLPAAAVAPVRVCIAYDDIAVGREAMDLAVKLAADCGGRVAFPPAFWRCDVLENDACRESAADDAEAADVIVIGLSRTGKTEGIGGWLEQALVRREGSAVAVVALVASPPAAATAGEARLAALAEIAARHGAEFFISEPDDEIPAAAPSDSS